jgi:hypothetical protein
MMIGSQRHGGYCRSRRRLDGYGGGHGGNPVDDNNMEVDSEVSTDVRHTGPDPEAKIRAT